ncbi:alkaline phosphatase D family protein [Nocardia puris]|nr:alkaline phosphatase D family protein [Nocardia puris]
MNKRPDLGVNRRRFLATSAVTASATVALGAGRAGATAPVFAHGVASGDPLPDRVILWTRVSDVDAPIAVRYEVARDEGFGAVVTSGTVTATAAGDFTVKVDASGLAPGTRYFYRFTVGGVTSPVGRTATAPSAGATPEVFRAAVVSCSDYQAGYFSAYRHLAARDDLDVVIELGDYLYEYGADHAIVRAHEPAHEMVTLADYRTRHAQYKADPDLQAAHAAHPWICTWDDHEFTNNAHSLGADNHDPATEGDWNARRATAKQAYLEWMPVRPNGDRIYRRLRYGTLLELSMLDLRTYRSAELTAGAGSARAADPDRTIMGAEQFAWAAAGIESSPAIWKLIGNSVMIAPLQLPLLDPRLAEAVAATIGSESFPASGQGLGINLDQWDGFSAERHRLLTRLAGITGVVFLTGDIHSSWANDVPLDTPAYPATPPVAVEFVATSVTSQNADDFLGLPPRTVTLGAEAAIRAANPHVRYLDFDSHGFSVLEVTPALARMDWFYVSHPTDPAATLRHGAAYETGHGGTGSAPMGVRAVV